MKRTPDGAQTPTTSEVGCANSMYATLSGISGGWVPQGSLLPTGSANSFAYPFVDSGMPSYITATTGCQGYQIYPTPPDPSGWGGGYSASDIAAFS
jgi:hypothetical protein